MQKAHENKNLILAELNEINFEIVKKYCDASGEFKNFSRLFADGIMETTSEKSYEHLEPWIQWPSMHCGKSLSEHGIFRLGDIVGNDSAQIFETVEKLGYKVGVMGAMNAENRLERPSFFIPDAWTDTTPDKSLFSQYFNQLIRQTVNDNTSNKITLKSLITLVMVFIFKIDHKHKFKILQVIGKRKNRKWYKALVLDLLISGVHKNLLKSRKTNFSTVFFNGFAHVQHHYFFMSPKIEVPQKFRDAVSTLDGIDPIYDCIEVYDFIIGELQRTGYPVIFATGLSQVPYIKLKYYYRLINHDKFLNLLNIKFREVLPRMTRDFLIRFDNNGERDKCHETLQSIKVTGNADLFTEFERRPNELFVTMGYPKKIEENTYFYSEKGPDFFEQKLLLPYVKLVDLKNGMHCETGYVSFPQCINANNAQKFGSITRIYDAIFNYFATNNVKKL